MSYRPQGLGIFLPTGGSCPLELALYQQYSVRSWRRLPNEYSVVVPARQAYSHSASLGRRIFSSSSSNFSLCISRVTALQKSSVSLQLTISMALRGPFHLLGFLPMTAWYSSWVASYLAMAKGLANVTLWAGRSSSLPPFSVPMTNVAGN